ncbi:hypothetical protein [Actinokineospora sp.]|uniref:hypothetical protein n=1 Tax=Actinokineospora sp. TaxID=1872133 RepID=UPI0040377690
MTTHPAVRVLLARRDEVDLATWRSFWDALAAGELRRGEPVALLASLTTLPPGPATTAALLASLRERAPAPDRRFPNAVNVVGTGGGPPTFNISTAAAFLAAAAGVRVVKTGSRAHTSSLGSYDLLDRLGVAKVRNWAEAEDHLGRHGVAFAGDFVYPAELGALARAVLPVDPRAVSGFLNLMGPFLAAVPVGAQLTGVADRTRLPLLRAVASGVTDRRIWLCNNDLGADELLGFAADTVDRCDGSAPARVPVPPVAGSLADLRPVADHDVVAHFLRVLAGREPVASRVVALNAAALAVAARPATPWLDALRRMETTLSSGAAAGLVALMGQRTAAVAV